ncbi:glycoside hydrolase family 3 N-terminal domain-containing protein [Micromonospora sp. NPDC048830]|uniref:glycoside hydrolase family 3 N-terminal domain-containing protein n=1 Tax=Micromonospora sp. NPDC048830 TaxID=3364257 RepID=UPI0037167FA5
MATDRGLRRLALGTILAAFPGHTPPPWAVELVRDGLAGHVLFGRNVDNPAQLTTCVAALREAHTDVLVAIDEEGGDVTRLAHATGSPYPGNAALGVVDDLTHTRDIYRAIGDQLTAVGITLDLAPVADVNSAADNPVIGPRSFGTDPTRVAAHTAAAVTGLQAAYVAACAKHFPGHGATVVDSHLELPTVDVPIEVLKTRDLPPFAAAIAADAKAIMSAHIRVPAVTGDRPATFSRPILTNLLRDEYRFTGTVITDALEMQAASTPVGGMGPAAVLALAAGADLLCLGATEDAAVVERVADEICTATRDGRLQVARLEQAVERSTRLAAWTRPSPGPMPPPTRLGYDVARRAVRVDGIPPSGTPLVVQLFATSTNVQGRTPWGLGPHLTGVEEIHKVAAQTTAAELRQHAGGRPIVVVCRRLRGLAGGPALVETLAADHPVTVVDMGWPSSWRPRGVRAFVTTYGASHANGRAAAEALGLVSALGDGEPPRAV